LITRADQLKGILMDNYYNTAFERSILSTFLFNPELFEEYKEIVKKDDFYLPTHLSIYNAMIILDLNNKPIDEEFIKHELSKTNEFDEIVMMEIMTANPIYNLDEYINSLKELSSQRKLLKLSTQLKDDFSTEEKIDIIKKQVDEIENSIAIVDDFSGEEIINTDFSNNPTYETGIDVVSNLIGGLETSQLIYITGAEETGKTHITYKIMENLSAGFKVGIISLEFGKAKLKERLLGMTKRGHKLEPRNIKATFESHSITKIEKIIKKWVIEGVRFIVLDSFNLVENNKSSNGLENVIDTGRRLFKLTQQLDILMMVISTSTKQDHKDGTPSIYGGQLLNHYCDQKWHLLRDLETEQRMIWVNKNKQNYRYGKAVIHFHKDGTISEREERYIAPSQITHFESENIQMEVI
jgi:replicative DNA helicase